MVVVYSYVLGQLCKMLSSKAIWCSFMLQNVCSTAAGRLMVSDGLGATALLSGGSIQQRAYSEESLGFE
jgi:hypothetical protein